MKKTPILIKPEKFSYTFYKNYLQYYISLTKLTVIYKKIKIVSFTTCKLDESVIQPLAQMNKKSKIIKSIDQQCKIP